MQEIYSVIVIIGIVATFVPQYATIIRRKSSLGISPVFLLFGITSVLAQLVDILLLQMETLDKCSIGFEYCFADLLGIIQVVVLTFSIGCNCVLFTIFYPKPLGGTYEGKRVIYCMIALAVFLSSVAIVVGTVVGVTGKHSAETKIVGQSFGILSTLISCVQYIPQIYKTWSTSVIGSLSPSSLAIQAPGSFFFAYTVAVRPQTDFTTWGPFFVSGAFQLILVLICLNIYQHPIAVNATTLEESADVEGSIGDAPEGVAPTETTPLVR